MQQQKASMTQGRQGDFLRAWCVVEYVVEGSPDPAVPPLTMMIAAVKLRDVFTFAEANRNSEWRRCITPDHFVGVLIHATGTMQECRIAANRMVLARNPRPRCNLHGYNSFSLARPLKCSNGETYETQAEACQALSLNTGQLSRHLKGELRMVKGYTFTYKD